MTIETNAERLKQIRRNHEGLVAYTADIGSDVINLPRINYEMAFLIQQAERVQESEVLIRRLYNHLGSSAEMDYKLWKETEAYVKALAGVPDD